MAIVGVQVIGEGSGTAGYTVEFVDDAGDVTAVRFTTQTKGVNRTNAVRQAKQYLERLVHEDMLPDEMTDGKNQDGRGATMAASVDSSASQASKD